jgi:hypothetical protein
MIIILRFFSFLFLRLFLNNTLINLMRRKASKRIRKEGSEEIKSGDLIDSFIKKNCFFRSIIFQFLYIFLISNLYLSTQ